jgi:hypothetical protein
MGMRKNRNGKSPSNCGDRAKGMGTGKGKRCETKRGLGDEKERQ